MRTDNISPVSRASLYYRKHYAGLTRGELLKRDSALYQRLRTDRLLQHVPLLRKDYGDDSLAYYRGHYAGLTCGQLRLQNRNLYEVLRRSGLLVEVLRTHRSSAAGPDRAGREEPADPLALYHARYAGWTLYQRLRRKGLLGQMPRQPSRYGDDLLAYYHEHCDGMLRGPLAREHSGLYRQLKLRGLLEQIPVKAPAEFPRGNA